MSIFSNKSKKTAAIVSYISLIVSTLSSMFLTKIILFSLGENGYGLYQMIYSLASNLMVLDLGIGTVMIRYISEYHTKMDYKRESNFAAMMGIISIACSIIITMLCFFMANYIGNIYPKLSHEEVITSRIMIYFMSIQFIFNIIGNYTSGYIQAYERFLYVSIRGIVNTIITFILTVLFLKLNFGCVGIVIANLLVIIIICVCDLIVLKRILNVKVKLYKWDNVIIRPAIGLMIAMFLQSIIGYINSSADKTILGIMCNKSDVTIYSIAATIITMFNTVPCVLSGFFQPQVTQMITRGESRNKLGDLVARVGRIQFMLCMAILGAFFLFGKDFLQLWVGENIAPHAWIIVMIIMPVNMVPLVQTICLSILNGYNKRLYRSIILIGMTFVNVLLTVILINYIGAIGAPIATAISYLIGHVILLNIYYNKVIKLDIIGIFKCILKKSWICSILAIIISYPLTMWKEVSIISFIIKCSLFCIWYFALLYIYGLNRSERNLCAFYFNKVLNIFKIQNKFK